MYPLEIPCHLFQIPADVEFRSPNIRETERFDAVMVGSSGNAEGQIKFHIFNTVNGVSCRPLLPTPNTTVCKFERRKKKSSYRLLTLTRHFHRFINQDFPLPRSPKCVFAASGRLSARVVGAPHYHSICRSVRRRPLAAVRAKVDQVSAGQSPACGRRTRSLRTRRRRPSSHLRMGFPFRYSRANKCVHVIRCQ
ncbi:hypothetical protein CEXT_280461 [Caerostris extrusa]|uniref:Uncharacterized protein n=1 Tax=Caerostris extrusa TaxID=172846 RepID=A0AAV4NWW6_CAEEX|nr:hypothetical protein CEXT_280461 [Caerostris extrusa]